MQQWTWRNFAQSTPFDATLWPPFNRRFRQLQTFLAGLLGLVEGQRTAVDRSTTPDVTLSRGLTLANTGTTSISTFAGGEAGQTVIVLATDARTTLVNSTTLRLTGAADWVTKVGETRQFWTPDAVTWYEVPRALTTGDVFLLATEGALRELVSEAGDILTDEAGNHFVGEGAGATVGDILTDEAGNQFLVE